MSTTILAPPIRVLKLTEGRNNFGAKISPGVPRINTFYDNPQSSLEFENNISEIPERTCLCLFQTKMAFHDAVEAVVNTIREPIAEIQEKRGVSRNHRYTFVDLVTALFQQSYNACLAMFTMILGLLPLLEGLLSLVRFVLDKILEINDTTHPVEKIFKIIVFFVQLLIIFVLVSLILSLILFPVYHLVLYCCLRVWGIVNG